MGSEGTKPPNFQEISLQNLQFPEEFRENFESSVMLIFSYLCPEARRTILNGHVGGFVLCNISVCRQFHSLQHLLTDLTVFARLIDTHAVYTT